MFTYQIEQWNEAVGRARRLLDSLKTLGDFFADYRDASGARLDSLGPVSGQQYSLFETLRHAQRAVAVFINLKLDADKPVAGTAWATALGQLAQVEANAQNLSNVVQALRGETRPLKIASGSTLTTQDSGELAYNLTDDLSGLVNGADGLLQWAGSLASMSRPVPRSSVVSEAAAATADAKAAAEALKSAEAFQRESRDSLAKTQAQVEAFNQLREQLQADLQSAQQLSNERLDALQQAVTQISAYKDESAENQGAIRSRLEDITKQSASAQVVAGELSGYQATLDSVKKRIEELESTSKNIVEIQKSQEGEVTNLLEQASNMLSSATVAGLSTAFARERDDLDIALGKADKSFIVGVIGLSAASLFVLAYILNITIVSGGPLGFTLQPGSGAPHKIEAAGVLARSIILIGPLWFTQFAASRYRQLFDLRQQYAHKYNVAFSADGFTKAAEKYRDDITLWVFETIGRNPVPTRRLLGRAMDDPPTAPLEASGIQGFGERLISSIAARVAPKAED